MPPEQGYTCRQCQGFVPQADRFCPTCGKELTDLDRQIGAAVGGGRRQGQAGAVRKAVIWMIVLGVMFAVFGTIFGFMHKSEADSALEVLDRMPAEQVFPQPVEGETYTVGELRRQVKLEVYLLFGFNYFLALAMFGLSFWARRSPFPAMVTAVCLYLAVIVANAIVEPTSIVQGILIKILFFGAMIAGIKASLEARKAATG
jgi:hypothetical protein